MPNLTSSSFLRILTLCSLYISQGLPQGFVTISLKNYLSDKGVALEEIGSLISMVVLPWAFKFFWGPLVDCFGIPSMGRRRPWLIFAQFGAVITIAGMVFIPNLGGDLKVLGWSILAINVFLSLQDVCTDALAVDLLSERERGKVNGYMYGCSFLGGFVGGRYIGDLMTREGGDISHALLALAASVFVISLLPLLIRERAGERFMPWSKGQLQAGPNADVITIGQLFSEAKLAFSKPIAILSAFYALLALIGYYTLSVSTSDHFIKEMGWDDQDYSNLESNAIWFSLGGAMLGGWLADRFGIKRVLLTSGTTMAIAWIIFGQLSHQWDNRSILTTLMFTQSACYGVMAVSSFSLFMSISNKKVAATQFTAYMSMLNLSNVFGNKLAAPMKEWLTTMPPLYLVCGIVHIAVMVFVLIALHPPRLTEERRLNAF